MSFYFEKHPKWQFLATFWEERTAGHGFILNKFSHGGKRVLFRVRLFFALCYLCVLE